MCRERTAITQALNPRDPAVLSGRGVCSMELGRYSQAWVRWKPRLACERLALGGSRLPASLGLGLTVSLFTACEVHDPADSFARFHLTKVRELAAQVGSWMARVMPQEPVAEPKAAEAKAEPKPKAKATADPKPKAEPKPKLLEPVRMEPPEVPASPISPSRDVSPEAVQAEQREESPVQAPPAQPEPTQALALPEPAPRQPESTGPPGFAPPPGFPPGFPPPGFAPPATPLTPMTPPPSMLNDLVMAWSIQQAEAMRLGQEALGLRSGDRFWMILGHLRGCSKQTQGGTVVL